MTRIVKKPNFELHESPVTAVATPVVLTITPELRHCRIGIQFFSDAAGTTPAVPGAGTVAIKYKTLANKNTYETAAASMPAPTPVTTTVAAHTVAVQATPTGVTVATHYKLVVSQSRN